jgi:peptidoglycan/LPS O-acetylase OafA/YrhL
MWSPFGPDTALGLVPAPHLFLFYGCFYWFGAGTYAAEGGDTPLGRRWPLVLPLSLAVLLPASLATIDDRAAAVVLQPLYAWGMSLGLIGLFHRYCGRPSERIRWLSDASYWMYLVHLPLVVVGQAVLRDLAWPVGFKFLVVLVAVVGLSLVTYRLFVRFTAIGWLLNGPRERVRPHG